MKIVMRALGFCIIMAPKIVVGMVTEVKEGAPKVVAQSSRSEVLKSITEGWKKKQSNGSQALKDLADRFTIIKNQEKASRFNAVCLKAERDEEEKTQSTKTDQIKIELLYGSSPSIERDVEAMVELQKALYGRDVITLDEFKFITRSCGVVVARQDKKIVGYLLSVSRKVGAQIAAKEPVENGAQFVQLLSHFDRQVTKEASYRYLMQLCVYAKAPKETAINLYTNLLASPAWYDGSGSKTGVFFTVYHTDNKDARMLFDSLSIKFKPINSCKVLGRKYIVAQYNNSLE